MLLYIDPFWTRPKALRLDKDPLLWCEKNEARLQKGGDKNASKNIIFR